MANYILFVFEGQETEKKIFKNLEKHFQIGGTETNILTSHCGDIYSLYHLMKRDSDLDLIGILKERSECNNVLSDIDKEDITETYLFFDYDGHSTAATDEKLSLMLHHFCEETDKGKLYISYPMVEALRHLKNSVPFEDVVVPAKNNIEYKKIVNTEGESCYQSLTNLSMSYWAIFLSEHCKKQEYLVSNSFTLPTKLITQSLTFEKQKEKHIIPKKEVAVLSAFPIFIADYFGCSKIPSFIEKC